VHGGLRLGAQGRLDVAVPRLVQRFYYRQLMYVVLFRSVKEAVSGRPVGWRAVESEAPPGSKAPPEPAPAEGN